MPSLTRRFVYRVVRLSVPVTFPDLTGRARHPRLRDDVGIVPCAGGRDALVFAGTIENAGYHRLRDAYAPMKRKRYPLT